MKGVHNIGKVYIFTRSHTFQISYGNQKMLSFPFEFRSDVILNICKYLGYMIMLTFFSFAFFVTTYECTHTHKHIRNKEIKTIL